MISQINKSVYQLLKYTLHLIMVSLGLITQYLVVKLFVSSIDLFKY